MKHRLLKRAIVMLLTLTMLVTGSGAAVFAESLNENAAKDAVTTEQASEAKEDAAQADDADAEEEAEETESEQALTAEDWEAKLPDEVSTDAREAMAEIAESQTGGDVALYKAFANADSLEEGDAAFVMFVLEYANVLGVSKAIGDDSKGTVKSGDLSIPVDADSEAWVKAIKKADFYSEASDDNMPKKGDIVFVKGMAAVVTDTADDGSFTLVGQKNAKDGAVKEYSADAEDIEGFVSLKAVAPDMTADEEAAEEAKEEKEETADKDENAEDVEKTKDADKEVRVTEEELAEKKAEKEVAEAEENGLKEQTVEAEITKAPGLVNKFRSIFATDDNGTEITISGYMPEDATAKAYPVKVEIPSQNVLAAYDITIYTKDENGNDIEWQPEMPLSVSITDNDLLAANKDSKVDFESLNVFHMKDAKAEPEKVKEVVAVDGKVTFDADSFSVYAVTENDPIIYTFQFYNGTEMVREQKIKAGDVLYEPSTPIYPEGTGERFVGWYYEADTEQNLLTFVDDKDYGCVMHVDTIPTDYADSNKVIKIQAKSGSFYYATFYDDTGYNTEGFGDPAVFKVVEVPAGETIDLSKVILTPQDNNHAFAGWSETKGGDTAIDSSAPVTLTGDESYYPVLKLGHRISFNNNVESSSVTYWPPVIVEDGKTIRYGLDATGNEVYHNDPYRPAFEFDGWYTDQACTEGNAVDIESKVPTGDMELFAKWKNVSQAKYSVNIWRQKVTDNKAWGTHDGTEEGEHPRTYDFVKTETRNAVAGTGEDADKWYGSLTSTDIGYGGNGDYKGFHFNGDDSASSQANVRVEVPADSSGVLNVYYDRDLMYYDFRAAIRRLTDGTKPAWSEDTLGRKSYSDYGLLPLPHRTATAQQTRTWISEILTDLPDGGYYTGLYGQSFEQAGYPDGWPEKINCVYSTETGTLSWRQTLALVVYLPPTPANYTPRQTTITTHTGTIDVRSYIETANQNKSDSYKDIFDESLEFNNGNVGAASIALNHYAQTLNGNYSSTPTHSTSFSLPSEQSVFTVSPKFTGFVPDYYIVHAIDRYGNESDIRVEYEDDPVIKGDEYDLTSVNVYHARNKHDVQFFNGNTEYTNYKVSNVFYLAPLDDGSINYPEPTKEGYTFLGWYTDEALSEPFDATGHKMPDANLRLFAKFEKNKYGVHINYDPDGLGASYSSRRYFLIDHGERLVSDRQTAALTPPEGYEFLGWYYTDAHGRTHQWISGDTVEAEDCHDTFERDENDEETLHPGNVPYYGIPMLTLTARYRLVGRVSVEYDAQQEGVTAPTDNNKYYSDSDIVIAGSPTGLPDGKTLVGWADKNNHIYRPGEVVNLEDLTVETIEGTKKVVLTAVYENGIPETHLVYVANNGTNATLEEGPFEFNHHMTLTENAFEYEGYRFMGWSKTQLQIKQWSV